MKSPTWTGYFPNATGSSTTNHRFSPEIGGYGVSFEAPTPNNPVVVSVGSACDQFDFELHNIMLCGNQSAHDTKEFWSVDVDGWQK